MLMVAEHINDVKKRNDVVGKLGSKKEGNPRTPTSSRASSAGSTTTGGGFLSRSVTKKFLRTSSKSKQAVGLAEQEKDEMFDTLAALVETTKSTVLRFTSEMKEWSRSTKTALEAQASMVEGWIEVYAPLAGEAHTVGGGHERLCVFLETVLKPVIDGPWKALVSSALTFLYSLSLTFFLTNRIKRFDNHFYSKLNIFSLYSTTLQLLLLREMIKHWIMLNSSLRNHQ